MKNPFKVNQVWISVKYPEKSFFIYQIYFEKDVSALQCNNTSFILTVKTNEKLFYEIVKKYQEKHNIKDRTVTNPFCLFGEYKIKSLKQYINKNKCELLCEKKFGVNDWSDEFKTFVTIAEETQTFQKIWKEYSK